MQASTGCTAFQGNRILASGDRGHVALAVKAALASGDADPILIFDDETGRQIDFDLRGTDDEVLARLQVSGATEDGQGASDAPRRGPGRPRLGVVAREVTLLPRHWEWLDRQSGGASSALRRLVEAASRGEIPSERTRQAKEAAYRFMVAMAGNFPGFEEATRALYAGQRERWMELISSWPQDVRTYAARLAERAF